jgi:hypothetical protein
MSTVPGSCRRRGWRIHFLMMLVLWCGVASPARAAQSISLELDDQQLDRLDRQLSALLDAPPPPDQVNQRLREMRASLPLNGGSSGEDPGQPVSDNWIGGELDALIRLTDDGGKDWRPRLIALEYRLSRLRRLMAPAPRHRPDRADLDRLEKILARPEYRPDEVRQSTLKRWWEETRSALRDLLRRLLGGGPRIETDQAGGGKTISSIVSLLVVSILVVLGIIKGRHLWQRRQRRAAWPPELARFDDPDGHPLETAAGPDDLRQQAARLAEEGEHREAIRLAYIASLLDLARREVMTIQPGSSNRDYLDIVRENPAIFPVLLKMTTIFEDFWYGEKEATSADYVQLVELARMLDQASTPVPGHV